MCSSQNVFCLEIQVSLFTSFSDVSPLKLKEFSLRAFLYDKDLRHERVKLMKNLGQVCLFSTLNNFPVQQCGIWDDVSSVETTIF